MATKTTFSCKNCGANSAKWIGRCPSCGEWNTYIEEEVIKSPRPGKPRTISQSTPKRLPEIDRLAFQRIKSGIVEFDRVTGDGLVPGSLVLIGGEPGIGKSTLVLQMALRLKDKKVLYVSGEESLQQLKLRAERIGGDHDGFYLLSETSLESLLRQLDEFQPELLIVDSIQTLVTERVDGSAGTISQIRECATDLMKFAKESQTPVILIGHINKEGNLAGPKVLEHMVDTVLQFEGDLHHQYRILRASKNRFGSTDELGIFEMNSQGLREVSNPSELLLSNRDLSLSGNAISVSMEGQRSLLLETQALVSTTVYSNPQRSTMGFDPRRLNMLLAVLEKRAGFRLATKDVFLNMAGGMRITDPATDLSVIAAILSSDKNQPLDQQFCFTGEIGLSGEARPVNRIETRLAEASRLGFRRIFIPAYNKKGIDIKRFDIDIVPIRHLGDLLKELFA
ncbi:MAG: DNA repair protein RadA [Bacteroidales bacterium]|nr:DNA repair protein RadA [Bacteroidales bacterium]